MYPAGLGAGPGPVETYLVDMPFPWGDNTAVTLPVQEIADDFTSAILPEASARANQLIERQWRQMIRPDIQDELDRIDVIKKELITAFAVGIGVLGVGAYFIWRKR